MFHTFRSSCKDRGSITISQRIWPVALRSHFLLMAGSSKMSTYNSFWKRPFRKEYWELLGPLQLVPTYKLEILQIWCQDHYYPLFYIYFLSLLAMFLASYFATYSLKLSLVKQCIPSRYCFLRRDETLFGKGDQHLKGNYWFHLQGRVSSNRKVQASSSSKYLPDYTVSQWRRQ
jgi:hypothetical protein